MIISVNIFSSMHAFFAVYPCEQINSVLGEKGTLKYYPGCAPYYDGSVTDQRVIVTPNFNGADPMEIAAALGTAFGTAGWLAFWIHAIIVEVYVSPLTSSSCHSDEDQNADKRTTASHDSRRV